MSNKPLKRNIITTKDGSQTLFIPELNENYHSINGALQESMHIYINTGLKLFDKKSEVKIFEVGFGTGLNALVTYYYRNEIGNKTIFHSVEKYPLTKKEYSTLNYPSIITSNNELVGVFDKMHSCSWDEITKIDSDFLLKKISGALSDNILENNYHIVYFDAFAPEIQPNLWTVEVFRKMYNALTKNGVLVTYSAKGQVRRNLQSVGFNVERLPGPLGKREMIRATKP